MPATFDSLTAGRPALPLLTVRWRPCLRPAARLRRRAARSPDRGSGIPARGGPAAYSARGYVCRVDCVELCGAGRSRRHPGRRRVRAVAALPRPKPRICLPDSSRARRLFAAARVFQNRTPDPRGPAAPAYRRTSALATPAGRFFPRRANRTQGRAPLSDPPAAPPQKTFRQNRATRRRRVHGPDRLGSQTGRTGSAAPANSDSSSRSRVICKTKQPSRARAASPEISTGAGMAEIRRATLGV